MSTVLLLYRLAVVAAAIGLYRTGHWSTWNVPRSCGFG
jgi:hypothetical protein